MRVGAVGRSGGGEAGGGMIVEVADPRSEGRFDDSGLVEDGRQIGSAFGRFLVWIRDEALRLGTEQIYFLSSEGDWFTTHYALMCERWSGKIPLPVGRHLEVSRSSTYLASFERIEPTITEPLIAQYPDASVRAVLTSLCTAFVAPEALARLSAEFDVDAPWRENGHAVLASPRVRTSLESYQSAQRAALIAYLDQQGIRNATPRALLVDIGWRGSIQDNLARLLPHLHWTGLYFHLQPFLVSQALNVTKRSFLLGEGKVARSQMRRLRFAAPLEFAVGGSSRTIVTYVMEGLGARPIQAARAGAGADPIPDRLQRFRNAVSRSALETALKGDSGGAAALTETLRYLEHPSPGNDRPLFLQCPRRRIRCRPSTRGRSKTHIVRTG